MDATLRLLKWLVVTLTATMIVGMIALIALLVTRFPAALPLLPTTLNLPDGVTASAVTLGTGWIAVVVGDEILIYDADGKTIRQRIAIE